MWPNAPMHLDSQTKIWVAAVILRLVADRRMRLDDTVGRWLPGVLPYGDRITVRELLGHTSGIVDQQTFDNDALGFIEGVRERALRTELMRFWRQLATDPTAKLPAATAIRFTATLPLMWKPGNQFHYSNIGYEIAGLIAAKAGGAPLGRLIEQQITRPLGLTSAAYVPGGEVGAAHPQDYTVAPDGSVRDATDYYRVDEGASGAMIASARDEARFLTSLIQRKLLPAAQLSEMTTPSPANPSYGLGIGLTTTCDISAYDHGGASYSTTSAAIVSRDGNRVAVILLNGNTSEGHSMGTRSSNAAFAAAQQLFCAA
jgi:D-alanyl-D-alanine carboxypeptidase